jgi:hypothetical protein
MLYSFKYDAKSSKLKKFLLISSTLPPSNTLIPTQLVDSNQMFQCCATFVTNISKVERAHKEKMRLEVPAWWKVWEADLENFELGTDA